MESKHFSRLGRRSDFQRNLDACKALKLKVQEDKEAGTITVSDGTEKVMQALRTQGGAWIVRYHREYFNEAA